MSVHSWWNKLRASKREPREQQRGETPEEKRFSSVDIAGHSAASEAKRLVDPK
jgi:hypothetical protein